MEALDKAIAKLRSRYLAANPKSQAADQEAESNLPGGNTRTVLHYEPFPLTMIGGSGAEVEDLDGHRYVDFVGEFSAGLFGHSDPTIKAAVIKAMDGGISMGAPTPYERKLAGLLCERFPSMQQMRFCNSGTEANLMALTTARVTTGREKVLAFKGAYHGGVIKFPAGNSAFNVPYDFVLGDYNDVEGTQELIHQAGDELAAVIVEPVLGAGGNISGSPEFLGMLRQSTKEVGALLIFDEVKTSRLGPSGVQGMLDIDPDLTTLGKFIAGGLPTGAFGGKAEYMSQFNPKQPGTWAHAGTFNNNVCSMAAGIAAMGEVYTADRAVEFFAQSEAFRTSLNEMFRDRDVPMNCNGLGSIFAIQFSREPAQSISDISAGCLSLRPLLHMHMLMEGVLICARGDFFLSLPMDETHFNKARQALQSFLDQYQALILQVIENR